MQLSNYVKSPANITQSKYFQQNDKSEELQLKVLRVLAVIIQIIVFQN